MKIADLEAHGLDLCFGFSKSSMDTMHTGKAVIVAIDEDYFGKNILKNKKNVIIVSKGKLTKLLVNK